MGLSRSMIGILAKNDNFYPIKGCECKCVENFSAGRINFFPRSFFLAEKVTKNLHFRSFEKGGKSLVPTSL